MYVEPKQIDLFTISEYSSEILAENKLVILNLDRPTFTDILDQIWDLYPGLYHEENYDIYWRFSKNVFLKVCDFYSYFTALTLMNESSFYLILRDSEPWHFGEKQACTCRDGRILLEALEEKPCPKYYTNSYKQIYRIINDNKRAYKKEKNVPIPPDDTIINQRPKIVIKADKKGKKDKKGKDDKKGKKKK